MPSFHELHGRFAYERFELLTVLSDENILRLWALDHRFAQSGRFHEPSLDVTLRQSPLAQGRRLEPLRRRAHQARSLSPLAQGRGLEHPVDPQRRAATGSPLAQGVDWNSTISLSAASPSMSPLAQGRGLEQPDARARRDKACRPSRRGVDWNRVPILNNVKNTSPLAQRRRLELP